MPPAQPGDHAATRPTAARAGCCRRQSATRLPPARHGLIKEPNRRAVLVDGQHLETAQRVSAPVQSRMAGDRGPPCSPGSPCARLAGLQWLPPPGRRYSGRSDARPNGIRQHLREALHLSRGVRRVNEPGTADHSLESGHGLLFVGQEAATLWMGVIRPSGHGMPRNLVFQEPHLNASGARLCAESAS